MCFKTRYIGVLIKVLFEFNHFVKLQNILKSRIHFNTSLRGAYNRVYFFFLEVDGLENGGGGLLVVQQRNVLYFFVNKLDYIKISNSLPYYSPSL